MWMQTPTTSAPVAADVPSGTEEAPAAAAETITPSADTVAPAAETVAPAAEEPNEATPAAVDEKAVVKEDKPKNNFFQKIVKRLLPKTSQNSPPSTAPPAASPSVAASA